MPSVEIVTIGTELLLGAGLDTNGPHIARTLAEIGIDVYAKHSVGDNAARLEVMLRDAGGRADGVVTTGGLGPTVDDLTKEAVARAVDAPLELHEPSLRAIEERFRRFGRSMTENNRRQAMLPRGCTVLENPHGTAPGFVVVGADGGFVACMPGVPREMTPMLAERLVPWLGARYGLARGIHVRTLRIVGMGESEVDRRIESLFRESENPKIAVLAHGGRIDVKLMAKAASEEEAAALIAPLEARLRERIGPVIYGVDAQTLEEAIVAAARVRRATIGTAESVTGGGIADAIVGVAGASTVFHGGIVAYANAVKTALLDVPEALLAAHGAVSAETAAAMAQGARRALAVDVAVASTGIAGPGGATGEKPVGLVWFAIADGERVRTFRTTHPGTRGDVRARAVTTGLELLRTALVGSDPPA